MTIITHGFNGNVTDWIIPMASQIVNYDRFPGTNYTCYVMSVAGDYSVTQSRIGGVSPLLTDSGEILIKLDWSQLADAIGNSTTDVADSVVPSLLSTTFVPELAGKSLAEFPIHLIGHSRGGSVVTEMARLLGMQGVWVDHVTTLDPHPVSSYGDAPVYVYENVLFADNYWQTNPDLFCPNGESTFGAYDRYLANLDNGYTCNHSDVHLWYHGTIDWIDTPASDSQATITSAERANWWTSYESGGLFAGFYYSLIGGGERLSADEPDGVGNGQIRDGYNQIWDFGAGPAGNRYALPSNNGTWPNIVKFNITGSNTITIGESTGLKLFYQYGATTNQSVNVKVFLDGDFNPYNSNDQQLFDLTYRSTGTDSVYLSDLTFDSSTNASPGTYAVYAKINDGTHSRYLYAPELLTINPNLTPPVFDVASLIVQTNKQFQFRLFGAIGQKVLIQASTNLHDWTSISTNLFSTTNVIYLDTRAPNFRSRMYRAVLAQ